MSSNSFPYDLQLIRNSGIAGIQMIVAQHESAYEYLRDETNLELMQDGSAALPDTQVDDFISHAGWAHFCCELV